MENFLSINKPLNWYITEKETNNIALEYQYQK